MFDKVIKLLSETETTNEYGDAVKTFTERPVFAEERSVSQTEFYQAQANGFKPEIKFVLADFLDYKGEKLLKYTPFGETEKIYEVIRTYRDKINLEIVCKRGID